MNKSLNIIFTLLITCALLILMVLVVGCGTSSANTLSDSTKTETKDSVIYDIVVPLKVELPEDSVYVPITDSLDSTFISKIDGVYNTVNSERNIIYN